MDREKYRRLFIDEARENIATLQKRLVEFEEAQNRGDGASVTRPMMDEIFRAAHSLKGMAAAMAFADFTKLSHALEELADGGRKGRRLDTDAVDMLLDAAARLAELVEAVADGNEPLIDDDLTDRVWSKVESLAGSAETQAPTPSAPAPETTAPETPVVVAQFNDTSARGAISAFMVLESWLAHADVERSVPDRDALKTPGTFSGEIQLVLKSGAEPTGVSELCAGSDAVKSVSVVHPELSATAPSDAGAKTDAPVSASGAPPVSGRAGAHDGQAAASADTEPAQERGIRVALDSGPLLGARAFMVHKLVRNSSVFVSMTPSAEQIRRGEFTGTEVTVVLQVTPADAKLWCARFEAEPGIRSADVIEDKRPMLATEKKEDERTVRVRTGLLDGFIDSVGELLLTKSRLNRLAGQYSSGELSDLADEIERVTRDLHDRVMSVRMMPLSTVTDRFGPVVRQLARKLDKTVSFVIDGAEIELDRAILDEIGTPLLHMVRNAVDHAHEGDASRAASDKPEAMRLRLRAYRDRDFVEVELSDDGGGIDPEAVAKKAVSKGLIRSADVAMLSDADKTDLICAAGFSMRDEVSETSGRGVGMDVVKSALEKLGGSLRISSQLGRGTRFVMRLPLTVAIIQVLVVQPEAEEQPDVYAIPIHRVERALSLTDGSLRQAHGQSHVSVSGQLVPLFDLSAELGFTKKADAAESRTAVLIKDDSGLMAFRVGNVVGQEEVVVKPLGAPLSTFEYLAGAALLADGRCAYILEPGRLPTG